VPVSSIPDVATIKADLCRLARAEKAFLASTGHYASEGELHEDVNTDLPQDDRMPYHYRIVLPVPESFVIVASALETSEGRLPAFVVDERLQLCAVTAGGPLQQPRSKRPRYDCQICDRWPAH
jgi:hypothetical protein